MVDIAEVKIWGQLAGALQWDEDAQLGYFQYDAAFLEKGWDLSPLKMPISNGSRVYSFPELRIGRNETEDTFKGLPGLLADALPDRYGNRLINMWLAQQGRTEESMNPVERLLYIGSRGMGALEFEPTQARTSTTSFALEMDSLVEVAHKILNEREQFLTNLDDNGAQAMSDILSVGTSAGGARPKAVIAYNPKTKDVRSGQGVAPRGFEHWLIKLDGASGEQFGESHGWGRVEYAYYLMARDCGIAISDSLLFEENGRAHFMTKRFDREGGEKHHVQTLCGLQHYNYNEQLSFSYEQVFQTMRQLRLTYPEAEEMFRRMVFNVMATNYDDHTKNVSFMMKRGGNWQLAPAYDLCYAYDPTNRWVSQQTLSVNGKRLEITKDDLMTVAKANSIKKGERIIAETQAVIQSWSTYATKANVRVDLEQEIGRHLNVG